MRLRQIEVISGRYLDGVMMANEQEDKVNHNYRWSNTDIIFAILRRNMNL